MTKVLAEYVYIDTNVFEHRQFDVQSKPFNALKTLAIDGDVGLLTSAVTVGECHKHIAAHVEHAESVRKKFTSDAWIMKRFPEYAVMFEKANKKDLTERLVGEFDTYLATTHAEHIPLNGANVESVCNQYFSGQPPFGAKGKKEEFPDALVLSALTAWCESKQEQIYVITRDKRMQEACTGGNKLHALTDITDFLDLVNSEKEDAAANLRALFSSRSSELIDDVKDRFGDLEFTVRDQYADVEIESVERVTFLDPKIITLDKNQASLEVECEVIFTALVTYEDSNSGIWDYEEERRFFTDTVERRVKHVAYVAIEVLAEYDSFKALADPEEPSLAVMDVVRQGSIELKVPS